MPIGFVCIFIFLEKKTKVGRIRAGNCGREIFFFWEYEKQGLTQHIMFFMYHFHLFGWPPGTQAKCIQTICSGTNFCFHRSKEKTRPLLT